MFFSFCPTKRIYGENSVRALAKELVTAERIAIVASGNAVINPALMDDLASLMDRVVLKRVFTRQGEPDYLAAARLAEDLSSNDVSCLIAIGGASIIDLVKAAAIMSQYSGSAETMWRGLAESPFNVSGLPIYVVSTLPGTSSESNSTFVISDPRGYKRAIAKVSSFPVAMAFDPKFANGIPHIQLHRGMFDALVHVLEQCIRPDAANLTNDGLCVSMISTLLDLHRKLLEKTFSSDDLVRYSRISTVIIDGSLLGRGGTVDAVTHEIATFLSTHFEMAHGTTLACVLPHYLGHASNVEKCARFTYLMNQSVAAVNAFYQRPVLASFDLRKYIRETEIVKSNYPLKSEIDLNVVIGEFLIERQDFWNQKGVLPGDVDVVLRDSIEGIYA